MTIESLQRKVDSLLKENKALKDQNERLLFQNKLLTCNLADVKRELMVLERSMEDETCKRPL